MTGSWRAGRAVAAIGMSSAELVRTFIGSTVYLDGAVLTTICSAVIMVIKKRCATATATPQTTAHRDTGDDTTPHAMPKLQGVPRGWVGKRGRLSLPSSESPLGTGVVVTVTTVTRPSHPFG